MSNHTETIFRTAPKAAAPAITINLDPAHDITPLLLGQAVAEALSFGTDDLIATYTGADALSAPLFVYGVQVGFINIGVIAPVVTEDDVTDAYMRGVEAGRAAQ